jgi:hypothetical protein
MTLSPSDSGANSYMTTEKDFKVIDIDETKTPVKTASMKRLRKNRKSSPIQKGVITK